MATVKVLNKRININAPSTKVWDALINPDIIKLWLFGTNVISEWKVGSQLLFTGNWQGTEYTDKGTILQFEKEKIFQYNYWSGFSGLPDVPENYSIITFNLASKNYCTELNLTQSNFASELMFEHSGKNWDTTLDVMKSIIEK